MASTPSKFEWFLKSHIFFPALEFCQCLEKSSSSSWKDTRQSKANSLNQVLKNTPLPIQSRALLIFSRFIWLQATVFLSLVLRRLSFHQDNFLSVTSQIIRRNRISRGSSKILQCLEVYLQKTTMAAASGKMTVLLKQV